MYIKKYHERAERYSEVRSRGDSFAVHSEDLSSVPSTQICQFTIACNCSSKGSNNANAHTHTHSLSKNTTTLKIKNIA